MLFIRVYDRFCRGKSRSATVVLAYLMQKNSWTLERALKKVRARRECVAPHDGFLAQLKLYESMGFGIDGSNVQFKMFREEKDDAVQNAKTSFPSKCSGLRRRMSHIGNGAF